MGEAIVQIAFFGAVITGIVDYIRNAFDPGNRLPKIVIQMIALAVAIAVAFIWDLNVLADFGADGVRGSAGKFVTALGFAASATGWHHLFKALSSRNPGPNPPGFRMAATDSPRA